MNVSLKLRRLVSDKFVLDEKQRNRKKIRVDMDKKINPQFLTKTGQKLARGVAWPSTLTNLEGLGHSQDFSLGATGRAPKARELGRLRRR